MFALYKPPVSDNMIRWS